MGAVIVGQGRWPQVAWVLAAAAVVLAATASWWSLRLRTDVALAETAIVSLERSAVSAESKASASASPDFSAQLPQSASAEAFVKHLQREASQSGVNLQLLTAKTTPSTLQALGRIDLSLSLRGSYAALKDVLAQTVALRGVVLQRLVMRRQTTPADVEAQLDLVLLSQPLRSAGN